MLVNLTLEKQQWLRTFYYELSQNLKRFLYCTVTGTIAKNITM